MTFLRRKAIPESESEKLTNKFMEAADRGDVDGVLEMIRRGLHPDHINIWTSDTGLMAAAAAGQPAVITALIAAGANPEYHNDNGQTALSLAALHNHLPAVQALLEGGANLMPDVLPLVETAQREKGGYAEMLAFLKDKTAQPYYQLEQSVAVSKPLSFKRQASNSFRRR